MSLAVKANGMNTCKTDSTSDDREKRMREAAIAEAERMNAVFVNRCPALYDISQKHGSITLNTLPPPVPVSNASVIPSELYV